MGENENKLTEWRFTGNKLTFQNIECGQINDEFGDLLFMLPVQTLINLRVNNYHISGTHHWGGHGRFLAIHPNEDFNLEIYYEHKGLHDSDFINLMKKVDRERKRIIEMLHNNGNQNITDLKNWAKSVTKRSAGHMLMTRNNNAPQKFDVPFMEAKNYWKAEINKRMYLEISRKNTAFLQNKKRKMENALSRPTDTAERDNVNEQVNPKGKIVH